MNATDCMREIEAVEATHSGRATLDTAQHILQTYARIKWPEGSDGAWFARECEYGMCINKMLSDVLVVELASRNGNDFGRTVIDLPAATQRALNIIDREAPEWLRGWDSCTRDNMAKVGEMFRNI